MTLPSLLPSDRIPLAEILITEELQRRPYRAPDHRAENAVLVAMAQRIAGSPDGILQHLLEAALKVCRAGSAGISMLEDGPDGGCFRWTALAGAYASHVGGSTPRHFSPCGVCLDRGSPQLYDRPARHFTYFTDVQPPIVEGLVLPFGDPDRPVGTIWVVCHDHSTRFDREDVRLMTSLGAFAAAAVQALRRAEQQVARPEGSR